MKTVKKLGCLLMVIALIIGIFVPISGFAATETTTIVNNITMVKENSTEATQLNQVDIVTFNDFHGSLAEDPREGRNAGMAKLVTAAREAYAANPNTIIVAGGDNYQGSALSNLTYGAPVSAMMKAMGVTASAVGNHEFDWGVHLIEQWARDGGFEFLAANIYDKATGEPVTWAKPYLIIEKGGIKVAFIGLAHPDTAVLTKREYVEGVEFTDPVEETIKWVEYLKDGNAQAGIPDVIIALTHIDSDQNRDTKEITGNVVKLANNVPGLDAIVSGHSHRSVAGTVNGVAIVQAGAYGRMFGKLSIMLNEEGKVIEIIPSLDDISMRKSDMIPNPEAAEQFETFNEELKPILEEQLGTATADFTHDRTQPNVSLLGKWAAEVMKKKTGVQVAIQNGGGLRRTMAEGKITMGDLYEIMPFDNGLVTMELSGADLKKAIDHGIMNPNVTDGQFAGLIVVFDAEAEFGNRIVSITLEDGTPLVMDQYYTVVVPDFIFTGGDNYDFTNAKNVVETYIPVRDMLVEAVKEAKILTPEPVTYIIEKSQVAEVVQAVIEEVKEPEVIIYVVKSGDVLSRIAKMFNTTYQKLAEYNGIKNPHLIFPGQKIEIPVH
ncbi:MAG: 5'-nucleotidase C-terminal domain-containing protein [Bacillota bacterium]